jgi:hypothetical protein
MGQAGRMPALHTASSAVGMWSAVFLDYRYLDKGAGWRRPSVLEQSVCRAYGAPWSWGVLVPTLTSLLRNS